MSERVYHGEIVDHATCGNCRYNPDNVKRIDEACPRYKKEHNDWLCWSWQQADTYQEQMQIEYIENKTENK